MRIPTIWVMLIHNVSLITVLFHLYSVVGLIASAVWGYAAFVIAERIDDRGDHTR